MIQVFKPANVAYYSRERKEERERLLNIHYKPLTELLGASDVVFLCVSADAGKDFLDKKELSEMKDDALLVSFVHPGPINEEALLAELKSGRLRAISDYPMKNKDFKNLPVSNWYSFKESNTNSGAKIKKMSNAATQSMINVLKTGKDQYKVN